MGEPRDSIQEVTVHNSNGDAAIVRREGRTYVMLRRDDRIVAAYRVDEDKLTRIVRWPRELGGEGGAR